METPLTLKEMNGHKVAQLPATAPILGDRQALLDLMANAYFQGAEGLLLHAAQLPPGFLDLKTKVAGDVLQSFSNYRMRLAIVLGQKPEPGSALAAFVLESNRGDLIRFAVDEEEAWDLLIA
jgi:hypothetical protein